MEILKRNNVRVLGSGSQTMVFAHGFGCDQNMWRFIVPEFQDHYKIILFDYVGAGHSDLSAYNSKRYSTLRGYAKDVIEILDELQLKKSIFIGHSVSAMIGTLAAIERPDLFSYMIFIGPSARYLNDGEYIGGFEISDLEGIMNTMDNNYLGWAETMAPAIMGNSDRPQLGEELTNSFCATNPTIAKEFAKVTFFSDNREDLIKLKVPTLSLQCKDDVIAPMEVGHYIDSQIPDHTLEVLEATGHCPHLSAPEEVVKVIKNYLKIKAT